MTTAAPLACTLGPHGTADALRLTLTNPTAEPVICTSVTLTSRPAAAVGVPSVAADDGAWVLSPDGPARHDLRPGRPVTLAPGERLDLVLTGLRPDHGTTRIEITPHTPRPASRAALHTVTGRTETITSFWADPPDVDKAGQPFTLHWHATAPTTGLTYTLCYGDASPVPVDSFTTAAGDGTWTCEAGITATTAFALIATGTEADKTVTSGRTLTVGVRVPDLVAGGLTADGTVSLLTEPVALLPQTSRTEPFALQGRATTDGLVAAFIQAGTGGKNAHALIVVTAANHVTHRAEATAPAGSGPRNLLTPVPRGATVAVQTGSDAGHYTAQITWYPMGRGPLQTT
ncbi:hypothetical protein ABTX81_22800 [Kitasatospora sp. NPDC097605]|uniref:hypothetical protein n=1 Tax=Kitasatospora sp. NPDC097605 TaxID=3157226 RepID=UPI0033263A63